MTANIPERLGSDWMTPVPYDQYWSYAASRDWLANRIGHNWNVVLPTAVEIATPTFQLPVQTERAQYAAERWSGQTSSDSLWAQTNRVIKSSTNLALIAVDFPVEVARTTMLGTLQGVTEMLNHPSWEAAAKIFTPYAVARAIPDTTANAFINTVQAKGWDYAVGPAGIGEGYVLGADDQVRLEKEKLARAFWTLPNEDPSTLGRWMAYVVGLDKESTAYGTLSGFVDALTYLLDPLNLIPGFTGVKGGEAVARGAKAAAAVAPTDLGAAARAAEAVPGAIGKADELRPAYDAARQSREKLLGIIAEDPELATKMGLARDQAMGSVTGDAVRSYYGRAFLNDMSSHLDREGRPIKEALDYFKFTAETVGQSSRAVDARMDQLANDIKMMEQARNRLVGASDEGGELDTGPAARNAEAEELSGRIETAQQERDRLRDTKAALAAEHTDIALNDAKRGRYVAEVLELAQTKMGLDRRVAEALADYTEAEMILKGQVMEAAGSNPDIAAGELYRAMEALFGIHDNGAELRGAFQALMRGRGDILAETVIRINRTAEERVTVPFEFQPGELPEPSSLVMLRDLLPDTHLDTLRRLSFAQEPEEVLAIVMDAWAKGDLELNQRLVNKWSPQMGKSLQDTTTLRQFEQRLISAGRRSAPDTSKVDLDDANTVVDFWDNWVADATNWMFKDWSKTKYRGDDAVLLDTPPIDAATLYAWRNTVIDEIAGATTWTGRKRALQQGQMRLIDELMQRSGLKTDEAAEMRSRLGQISDEAQQYDRRMQHVTHTVLSQDTPAAASRLFGAIDDPARVDPSLNNLIVDADHLRKEVTSPDPRQVRKLLRMVQEREVLEGELRATTGQRARAKAKRRIADKTMAINDAYDAVLRPLYLAFRPGYVLLQFADGAARAHLTGGTNMLSNPLQVIGIGAGLMTGKRPFTEKALEFLASDVPKNADGMPMWSSEYTEPLQLAVQQDNAVMLNRHLREGHFRDFLRPDNVATRKIRDGYTWYMREDPNRAGKPTPGWERAWGHELMSHLRIGNDSDELFRVVARLNLTGELDQPVLDWYNTGGRAMLPDHHTDEDIVVEYFLNGWGSKQLAEVADAAWAVDGVPSRAGSIFTDRDLLRAYLFDTSDAGSKATRVQQITGGDRAAFELIDDLGKALHELAQDRAMLGPKFAKKVEKAGANIRKYELDGYEFEVDLLDADNVADEVAKLLKHRGHPGPPSASGPTDWFAPPAKGTAGMGQRAGESLTSAYTWFFENAANVEKYFTHAPWVRDELWLQQSRRVALLTPEDAEKAAEAIRSQIPKVKRSKKQQETLRTLDESVRRAAGNGDVTIDDIVQASYRAGIKHMSETFYGIRGRNATAQRMAILWPFWQAAANAYKVYARGAWGNKRRALNATRLWENAQTEESGVLYELPGMPPAPDPSYGFVFQDGFGNQRVRIPLLGYARRAVDIVASGLTGGTGDIKHPSYLEVRTNMWNPINFGEPLPGVGPGISFPVNMANAAFNERVPLWLTRYVQPYQSTDVAQDQAALTRLLPAHLAALVGTNGAEKQRWIAAAATALLAQNPDKYTGDSGFVTEEKKTLLLQDAADNAVMMMIGQIGANMLFRGGTTRPQNVADADGGLVAAAVVYEEFNALRDETSASEAYAAILDKYGMSGLAYIIGNREFDAALTGDAGFRAMQSNPRAFRESPAYFGYFYPTSEWRYNSPEYRRALSALEFNQQKGVTGKLEDVNWVLYNTAKLRLEQRRGDGEITDTQFEAGAEFLRDQYGVVPQNEFNTKRVQQRHDQLRTLLTYDDLRATPVGQALVQFYGWYDVVKENVDGNTFDGKTDARWRYTMRTLGDELARVEPEFQPLWTFELRGEFLEEGATR